MKICSIILSLLVLTSCSGSFYTHTVLEMKLQPVDADLGLNEFEL